MKNYIELITEMKNKGEGLMSEGQYLAVGKTLDSLAPCNFLVFGLGHDAYICEKINHKGRKTFLRLSNRLHILIHKNQKETS